MKVKLDKFTTRTLLFSFFLFIALPSNGQFYQTEYWVNDAFNKILYLEHLSNITLKLEYDPAGSTKADRDGTVIINIPQVQNIIEHAPVQYQAEIVGMVVGHELAHETQYQYYKADEPYQLLEECQADVMTGIFTAMIKNPVINQDTTRRLLDNSNFSTALNKMSDYWIMVNICCDVLFQLGDDYAKNNSHPRRQQRLTAVRTGFNFGAATNLEIFAQRTSIPLAQSYLHKRANDLVTILDYRRSDNYLVWSLRVARCILHSPIQVTRDIAVFSYAQEKRGKDTSYFYYQHRIKNLSKKPVNLLFYDQVFTAPEDSVDDLRLWHYVNSVRYEKTIRPGDTYKIYGRLAYLTKSMAPRKHRPLFVKLGDPNSFYYCTKTGISEPRSNEMTFKMFAPNHEPPASTFYNILFSDRDRFTEYIAGIGRCPQNAMNVIYYPSAIQVPGAKETVILRNLITDLEALEVTIYEGSDQAKARAELESVKAILTGTEFLFSFSRLPGSPGIGYWDILTQDGKIVGQIMLRESPALKLFKLVLTIYRAN